MCSRLNTRQALRGRAVQFKEAAGHPLPVLLPSSFSHGIRSPPPPVCHGDPQSPKSTVLTVRARRTEQSTSPRRGKLRGGTSRVHPNLKTTSCHQGGAYSSTSPSRKPCSTTVVCQGRHPRHCPPWGLLSMRRSELDPSFTPTFAFIISYDHLMSYPVTCVFIGQRV